MSSVPSLHLCESKTYFTHFQRAYREELWPEFFTSRWNTKKNPSNKLYWQATIKLCTEIKCSISITLYLWKYLFSLQILTIQCKLACLWPSGTAYSKIKCFASSVSTFCNVNFAFRTIDVQLHLIYAYFKIKYILFNFIIYCHHLPLVYLLSIKLFSHTDSFKVAEIKIH